MTVATGGRMRCERNQIVMSMFGIAAKAEAGEGVGGRRPRGARASTDAPTDTTVLFVSARRDSGDASWVTQLSMVGSKLSQGTPSPETVNVSMGLRSPWDIAQ